MDSDPEWEDPIKEAVRGMDSGLVGLHMKGVLSGESFTMSRNWIVLGRAVSSESNTETRRSGYYTIV